MPRFSNAIDASFASAGIVAGQTVVPDHNADVFCGIDPSTKSELPGRFADPNESVITSAAMAASKSFELLASADDFVRGELLSRIAQVMTERRDEIIARCQFETGYLAARVEGEFSRSVMQLGIVSKLAHARSWDVHAVDPADPDRSPVPRPELRRRMVPVGPVAVFGACNFPLAISVAGNDTVAALASGNPVVVKSHPSHPGTCELIGRCIAIAVDDLGLPAGVFSLLHGRTPATSVGLVQHPAIKAVGFTGSPQGGLALSRAALERSQPIPVFAELGSTNPVFVTDAAVKTRGPEIADGYAASLRFGNGHMCTKPGILVMTAESADAMIPQIKKSLANTPPLPMLSGAIAKSFDQGVDSIEQAEETTSLYRTDDDRQTWIRGPHWFSIDAADVLKTHTRDWLHGETFGPVSLLVRCASEDEMLEVASQFSGSLTTTLHHEPATQSVRDPWLEKWRSIAGKFAGRVISNGWPTGMEIGPATHHGGPFPASLDGSSTSVGHASLERFVRPICWQNW